LLRFRHLGSARSSTPSTTSPRTQPTRSSGWAHCSLLRPVCLSLSSFCKSFQPSVLCCVLLCLRSLLIRSHTAWLQPSAPRAPRWSLVVSACLLLPMQLLSAPLRASWAWLSVAHAAMLALVYGSLCLGLVGLPCVSSYVCCSHAELVFCGSCSSCHYLCWHLGFAFSSPCSHSCTRLWLLVFGARESPM